MRRALGCALLLCLAACGQPSASDPLLVFAASDLRDALTEIARQDRAAAGDSVSLVFGSTGDLAAQIDGGAPADLFFAASAAALDGLARRGRIVESTRVVYAIGRLAVIARDGHSLPAALDDIADSSVRTVAIADPAHAPYGMAAEQALTSSGLLEQVRPKLVLAPNVSQAEQFVSTGNADVGIIALSLVLRDSTRRYTTVPDSLHAPLRQSAAVVASSTRADAARRFLARVMSTAGRATLRRYGFTLADSTP